MGAGVTIQAGKRSWVRPKSDGEVLKTRLGVCFDCKAKGLLRDWLDTACKRRRNRGRRTKTELPFPNQGRPQSRGVEGVRQGSDLGSGKFKTTVGIQAARAAGWLLHSMQSLAPANNTKTLLVSQKMNTIKMKIR